MTRPGGPMVLPCTARRGSTPSATEGTAAAHLRNVGEGAARLGHPRLPEGWQRVAVLAATHPGQRLRGGERREEGDAGMEEGISRKPPSPAPRLDPQTPPLCTHLLLVREHLGEHLAVGLQVRPRPRGGQQLCGAGVQQGCGPCQAAGRHPAGKDPAPNAVHTGRHLQTHKHSHTHTHRSACTRTVKHALQGVLHLLGRQRRRPRLGGGSGACARVAAAPCPAASGVGGLRGVD